MKKSQQGTCRPGAPLPTRRPQEPAGERPRPWDMALLGAPSPLPASQPPRPSGGKGVAPRCRWALAGHGESGRVCWRGCRKRCPGLSEHLRGRQVAGGRRCRVLADPARAGSLTASRGHPSACDLPLQAWFSSPLASLLSIPSRPCSPTFCLPEALPLRRLNDLNFFPSLGR